MPVSFTSTGVPNIPKSMPTVRSFANGDASFFEYPYSIAGVTKDANGAVLGACALVLFRTADNSIAAQGVSDASGNYRLDASPYLTHYLTAYKAGVPDVAGVTVNTLVGS